MRGFLTLGLAAVFLLTPVQCITLPMNMTPADLLTMVLLPVCWYALWSWHARVRFAYGPAMTLLFCTACLAVVASDNAVRSGIAVAKEVYLYAWLVTFASCLRFLGTRAQQRVWSAWLVAALANGVLLIAQFLDPTLLVDMGAAVQGYGMLDAHRPSGLMSNCNSAAFLQLSALSPLALVRMRPLWTVGSGGVLLLSIVATGSMGALTALGAGLLGLLVLALCMGSREVTASRIVGGVAAGLTVSVLLVVAIWQWLPGVEDRIAFVLTDRGTGSAAGRMAIWQLGLDTVLGEFHPVGIGPEMFSARHGIELHNDILAFTVERGLLGLAALLLLIASVAGQAWMSARGRQAVFVAAIAAMACLSLTHEIFHQRPTWMLLLAQVTMSVRVGNRAFG